MKTVLSILVLMGLISIGTALKCYICNSHNDPDCHDLSEAAQAKFLQDCNDENEDKHNYTICRKLHMFMDQDFTEMHPAQDRVHRSCGYIEEDDSRGPCYYKSGYNTRTWVCHCTVEGCNSAPASLSSPFFSSLAAFAALLGVVRFNNV